MNLYFDDNRADRRLAALLRREGHTVVIPADALVPSPNHAPSV